MKEAKEEIREAWELSRSPRHGFQSLWLVVEQRLKESYRRGQADEKAAKETA